MSSNNRQMSFDFAKQEDSPRLRDGGLELHAKRISGHLTIRLPEPVDVVLTNNRSTMVSFRRRGGRLEVRVHRLFRLANESILDALAMYIGNKDKASSRIIDDFILEHKNEIKRQNTVRKAVLHPRGKHYDLSRVIKKLNDTYFNGEVDIAIGWGRAPKKRKSKRGKRISRALATYSYDDRAIRVSPILDSKDVPGFIIDWVVYHEMLHHVIPIEERQGKKLYHTERFKNLEKAFLRYEDAREWEKANIDKLLI